MSKHIPILFSTAMVQAILEGPKTQTRRVVKPQLPIGTKWWEVYDGELNYRIVDESAIYTLTKCPYGQPGDVLWVRETFYKPKNLDAQFIGYRYSNDEPVDLGWNGFVKKPGIHMPKAACRIFLKVISVRVERLQDISEQDAMAEGVNAINVTSIEQRYYNYNNPSNAKHALSYVVAFESLWQTIHAGKPSSWENNPWVWVVEFERCEKPDNFGV